MNRQITLLILGGLLTAMTACHSDMNADPRNNHYPSSRPPLVQAKFAALPLGAVKPAGWLEDQLTLVGNGLTGHLDEFWPSLTDTAWKGADKGEGWERGPYYLDGLVPLAYLLDDPRLIAKVKEWIDPILASGRPNGWFGPTNNDDRWPLAVAMKVLTQYAEATDDERVVPLLMDYFDYLETEPPDWPDGDWRGVRAMENVVTAYWLYNRTGDEGILKAADKIYNNSYGWTDYFTNFPYPMANGFKLCHGSHVVNIAMATKHPGLRYYATGDDALVKAVYAGLASLDEHHGQVGGRFSGDEHLSGKRPTQGTELCGIVEFMFSLENLVEILGDTAFADRLESLAYNANPGTCTADYWAHQYDQQANQVLVSVSRREWSDNSDTANLYGLEPHYGCCTANMHQGWPKFVSHMWMATPDNGLAAIAYGPNSVTAKVADGTDVTITQATDYPFDGKITLTVDPAAPVRFPLHLRIPGWADGAKIKAGGESVAAKPGSFAVVDRTFKPGDTVELDLPMKLRTETRYNNSVAILRGPLYYSLKIGEKRTALKRHIDDYPNVVDWQIEATTPWNVGLIVDRDNPEASIKVVTRDVSKTPFDTDAAPVTLRARGKQLPDWKIVKDSADDPPTSPAASDQPTADLELIPYGSTRLRVTEFPVIKQ